MGYFMNKAIIVGNLTDDPELKYTPGGHPVCKFGVATNRGVKKDDEWDSVATFHKVVVWGKTAEWFAKSYGKGHKVMVEGRIDNRSYEDKEGNKRFISEIVAYEIIPMVQDNRKASYDEDMKEEIDNTMNEDIDIDDVLKEMQEEDPIKSSDGKGTKVPF